MLPKNSRVYRLEETGSHVMVGMESEREREASNVLISTWHGLALAVVSFRFVAVVACACFASGDRI